MNADDNDGDEKDPFGEVLLHFAAQAGDLDEVRRLLAEGRDINAFDDIGKTPLHYAVMEERLEVALVLILVLLVPVVRQGSTGIRFASWVLAVIMFMNGVGHLAGSAYFERWLPGATTAPLLPITSLALARAVWFRSGLR